MANYIVMTGDGDLLCAGVSEHEIERIAQAWADRLAETVYYSADSDDEDTVTAVEPRTVRCECGVWTGERCVWTGPRSQTVVVEYMPKYLRASHQAAGNAGLYPANGAVRVRVERYCAGLLLLNEDERDWARIVGD